MQGRISQLVNNYANISFNFGPTVLSWMQHFAAESYQAILEADKQSQEKFSGHAGTVGPLGNLGKPPSGGRDRKSVV